jgi:hypothetical protein
MRAVIREAIITDAMLLSAGVTPEATLAGDIDTPAVMPFLNLKWGPTTPAPFGGSAIQTTLTIWVHDKTGDYDRIDVICNRLRVLLPSLVGLPDMYDYVSQVAWTGDSSDLQDDGHRTVVRQSNFTINGSMNP